MTIHWLPSFMTHTGYNQPQFQDTLYPQPVHKLLQSPPRARRREPSPAAGAAAPGAVFPFLFLEDPTSMPGTIQVSVLDLLDLPSEAKGSLVSLKVAMGKREYQTTDKGEFSFPVVSLRENLIVALHDTEGNVVSCAEFKTISVVEKGVWDDIFPLEGGGHVHMKLQFLLKEEEHRRIRELRESAVKRKLGEGLLPKVDIKNSSSEPWSDSDQSATADGPNEYRNSLITASMQKVEGHTANSSDQLIRLSVESLEKVKDNQEKIKMQSPSDGISERIIPSEKTLDPYRKQRPLAFVSHTEDISIVSAKMEDSIYSAKRKNSFQRSSINNVKKMISAFENNTSQELRPHFAPNAKPSVTEGSIKKTSPKESPLKEVNFQQDMEILKSVVASKQENVLNFDIGTKAETTGINKQLLDLVASENLKNLEPHKQKAYQLKEDGGSSMDTLNTAQPHNYTSTSTALRMTETEKVVILDLSERSSADPILFKVEEGHPTMTMLMDSNALQRKLVLDVHPKENYNGVTYNAHGNSDNMTSSENSKNRESSSMTDNPIGETSLNEDKMDGRIRPMEQIVADYSQQSQMKSAECIHKKENKNDTLPVEDQLSSEDLLDKMDDDIRTMEQIGAEEFQLSHKISMEYIHEEENNKDSLQEEHQLAKEDLVESVNINEPCSSPLYQYDFGYDSGTSVGTVDLFTYSDYEKFPIGSLGIWLPKRLCVTSGSKQLRDLVECSDLFCDLQKGEKIV